MPCVVRLRKEGCDVSLKEYEVSKDGYLDVDEELPSLRLENGRILMRSTTPSGWAVEAELGTVNSRGDLWLPMADHVLPQALLDGAREVIHLAGAATSDARPITISIRADPVRPTTPDDRWSMTDH